MKPIFKAMAAMANDKRISDKNFRNAIKSLFDPHRDTHISFNESIKGIAQEAVYETERDSMPH